MPKRSTVYVRLPADVKEQLEGHARMMGVPISTAASEMLGLGLVYRASKDAFDQLQQNVDALETAKHEAEDKAHQLETKLQSVQVDLSTRMRFWEQAYNGVVRDLRAITSISPCPYPSCGHRLSAYDLVLDKRCPQCNQPVAWNPGSASVEAIRSVLAAIGAAATIVLVAKWLSE